MCRCLPRSVLSCCCSQSALNFRRSTLRRHGDPDDLGADSSGRNSIAGVAGAVAAGLSYQQGIFWGFLLSLSSTAIVLKSLAERGDSDSLHGQATVAILIFQDLAMVPMMLVTPILATQSGSAAGGVVLTLVKALLVVGLIVTAAWYLVPLLLQHIVRSRSRELFLLSIIVLCLGIAWLTSLGGLSLALGAFIAGLVIAESEYSHQALAEVLPFRDSFNSLFFVSIGVLMDPRVLLDYPLLVLGLSVAIILGKFLAGTGAVLAAGSAPRAAVMAGVALAQVGDSVSFLRNRDSRPDCSRKNCTSCSSRYRCLR